MKQRPFWTSSVVGVVILGVIASALWDGGKLIGGWAGSAALNALTLGIDSLKDHIYWRAADSTAVELAVTFQSRLILASIFLCGTMVLGGLTPRTSAPGVIASGPLLIGLLLSLIAAVNLVNVVKTSYSYNLATYREGLATAAAANMTEQEIRQTNANRLSVHDKASFIEHIENLRQIAELRGAKMPTMELP